MIDTRTVVTQGKGSAFKMTLTGQTRSTGLLVALIMGPTEHQSPGMCIFLYLAPVLTIILGRLMSRGISSHYPRSPVAIGPESALMSHWVSEQYPVAPTERVLGSWCTDRSLALVNCG